MTAAVKFSRAIVRLDAASATVDERRFYCPNVRCGRRFNRKYTLTEHIKTHTGEKPHICRAPTCGRKFATSSNLSRHMRLHGPLPLARCPMKNCTRTFLSDIQLARHQKQHAVPQARHCQATGCNKTFSTTGNLNRHVKKHHGGRQLASLATSISPVTTDRDKRSCTCISSPGVSPTGVDQRHASSDIKLPTSPAPTDAPCNDPWSSEMLDILGQLLLDSE